MCVYLVLVYFQDATDQGELVRRGNIIFIILFQLCSIKYNIFKNIYWTSAMWWKLCCANYCNMKITKMWLLFSNSFIFKVAERFIALALSIPICFFTGLSNARNHKMKNTLNNAFLLVTVCEHFVFCWSKKMLSPLWFGAEGKKNMLKVKCYLQDHSLTLIAFPLKVKYFPSPTSS